MRIKKNTKLLKQYFYRQMVYEQPHDISFIREVQQDFKKHKIGIPIIFCGYMNELDQIEYHPNRYINTEAKKFLNSTFYENIFGG